jgi:glycine/D-amino acid oxidase-like deaminating enzyme
MHTQTLIIGQGLSGSWLSYYLQQLNISCIVIDENISNTASKIASGIINPVTGMRYVKTWMIDEAMPFATQVYQAFACIQQKNMLEIFENYSSLAAFEKRLNEEYDYVQMHTTNWASTFNYNLSIGEIDPCYLVDVNKFLKQQKSNTTSIQEKFDEAFLQIENDKIIYKDITADKIIFCDGISSIQNNYFKYLPFALNKGEALIIECKDLSADYVFKNEFSIVPWADNLFWVGASFQWKFEDNKSSEKFRKKIITWLNSFLKLPYKIIDHLSAVRPANNNRKPFIGFHPIYKNIGILNGMGSKGVLYAPYFANQLAQHIALQTPIQKDVDIMQFYF